MKLRPGGILRKNSSKTAGWSIPSAAYARAMVSSYRSVKSSERSGLSPNRSPMDLSLSYLTIASFTRRFLSGGTGVRQAEHPKVASAGPTHPSGRPTQGRDGGSLPDLARQVRANAEQLGVVLARGPQARDVPAQVADDARGVVVGSHPERVGLLPLPQIGDLVEDRRDIGIVPGQGGSGRSLGAGG